LRIVGNIVIVVGVGNVSEADSPIRRKVRNKEELLQTAQVQICEKLHMLQTLQLQLGEFCNCN
jgi:peptidoglycan hydrolase CwlO-like protein